MAHPDEVNGVAASLLCRPRPVKQRLAKETRKENVYVHCREQGLGPPGDRGAVQLGGNLDVAEEVYAPDFVGHDPTTGDIRGIQGAEQFGATMRSAFCA